MSVRWDTVSVAGKSMRVFVGAPDDEPECAGILVAQHGAGVDGFVQHSVVRLFRQG